jgi:exodeoxyribonuclease III
MNPLKIATWNVNSIRTRLSMVLDWLDRYHPDVLCIQETKTQDEQFPEKEFLNRGHYVIFTGQKAYNGMAIISTVPCTEVQLDFPENPDSSQKRFLSCKISGVRLINVYIPNGAEVGSASFSYKLAFIGQLHQHLERLYSSDTALALVGDFNVAPEARDVFDPQAMEGQILFHPAERSAIAKLSQWGLIDLFRLHHDQGGHYTWWDYRMNAFQRNLGLRIDHIWVTPALAKRCTTCEIDQTPRGKTKPSDHVPVIATFRQS